MNFLGIELADWFTAVVSAGVMSLSWLAGWWLGRKRAERERNLPPSKFQDAILALLGLLLGFTFSMSLVKHEQRRQMSVTDANAIGDFYTCASLLKQPVRGKLQAVVRTYVEHRIGVTRDALAEPALTGHLDRAQKLQSQMQLLVEEAVNEGTPITIPLVNTLNEVTSAHAARVSAGRDRLPWSILLLLTVAAVLSLGLTGRQQAVSGEWHPGAALSFIVLVSMVIWVTLDLNQPARGFITISQEPFERLLKGME